MRRRSILPNPTTYVCPDMRTLPCAYAHPFTTKTSFFTPRNGFCKAPASPLTRRSPVRCPAISRYQAPWKYQNPFELTSPPPRQRLPSSLLIESDSASTYVLPSAPFAESLPIKANDYPWTYLVGCTLSIKLFVDLACELTMPVYSAHNASVGLTAAARCAGE